MCAIAGSSMRTSRGRRRRRRGNGDGEERENVGCLNLNLDGAEVQREQEEHGCDGRDEGPYRPSPRTMGDHYSAFHRELSVLLV